MKKETKRCCICHLDKPRSSFCRISKDSERLQAHCRACANKRYNEYRKNNPDKMRERRKLYETKYPEKIKAQWKVHYALLKGVLVRGVCEVCGKERGEATPRRLFETISSKMAMPKASR